MDREILFRGKRLNNGEWVYGYYVSNGGVHHYIFTGKLDITGLYPTFVRYEVDPATVGQYTGLTGKNGKKIFEGDRCRVTRHCILAYGKITFANGCFWFEDDGPGGLLRLCDIKPNGFEIEVIGNIRDEEDIINV